jgi:hypothetical protein
VTYYYIRGYLIQGNQEPQSKLRIEACDQVNQPNKPLGSDTTDQRGYFEIEFTDADFQCQNRKEPDIQIQFQVYSQDNCVISAVNRWEDLTPGKEIKVGDFTIQIKNTEKTATEELNGSHQPAEIVDIDVLPTFNQFATSSMGTALGATDNQGGTLQQLVNNAFNQVLGQNPNLNNPQTFLNLLTQTFIPTEANGRVDYIWNPRTYAPVQTELGGTLSGALASLYHRAKTALNEILPLLDKLYPLDPAADPENVAAVRSIVRVEVIELVNALASPSALSIQRVDSLFELIQTQLRNLATLFGLQRDRINTVEEEQNYSNFLIVQDYITSLEVSWETYVTNTNSPQGAFLGTQLVLLSQALCVVAESVQEVFHIMNHSLLGPEERKSLFLNFEKAKEKGRNDFPLPDGTRYQFNKSSPLLKPNPMNLEALLQWVRHFATEEAPALAKQGGSLGIDCVLEQTATKLMILVQATSYIPVNNFAFKRKAVEHSLRDLAAQLYEVIKLGEQIKFAYCTDPTIAVSH